MHPKVVQIEGFSQGDFTAPHVCSLGTVSIVSPTSEHNTSLWDTVLGRKIFLMSLFSQKANQKSDESSFYYPLPMNLPAFQRSKLLALDPCVC